MSNNVSDKEKEKWMASAEAREATRGNKPSPIEAHKHAGIIGDNMVRRLLSIGKNHYDPDECNRPMPDTWEETRVYKALTGIEATETLTRAVHQGDTQTQSYFVGDPGAQSDISGLKAINRIAEIVEDPAPIVYIWAKPGSGKTNFALLLAQLWRRAHPEDGAEMGSNIRTWEESDATIRSYGELTEWIEQGIDAVNPDPDDRPDPRLFLFDEASSHASGRGKDGYEAGSKLGPLVYKIRKYGGGLFIIGHDGKDVHPAVRTQAYCIYKESLKTATVYEDVENRQGVNEVMSLTGIPATDYHYDDLEATSWNWDGAGDDEELDREELIKQIKQDAEEQRKDEKKRTATILYKNGIPQGRIGDIYNVTQQTISNWIDEVGEKYYEHIDPVEDDDVEWLLPQVKHTATEHNPDDDTDTGDRDDQTDNNIDDPVTDDEPDDRNNHERQRDDYADAYRDHYSHLTGDDE